MLAHNAGARLFWTMLWRFMFAVFRNLCLGS